MKNFKLSTLVILFIFSVNINAQKKVLKVNYETTFVTEFMLEMLKEQIKDQKESSEIISKVESYKVYSSFYQYKKESVFVMDSIKEERGVSIMGHYLYSHLKDNNLKGSRTFAGKTIVFETDIKDLNWTITDEQKEINNIQCKRAFLTKYPFVSAWFTPTITSNGGAYISFGLPGLVMEVEEIFEKTVAVSVAYQKSNKEFNHRLEEVKKKHTENKEEIISISNMLSNIENFKKMMVNQKGKKE